MGFPLRLYSIPNVFRYERPQRGRLREHWQLNVDLFGSNSLAADAEIIAVAHAMMLAFGATEQDFTVKLGSRNFLDEIATKLNLSVEDAKELRNLLDRRAKMPQDDFVAGVTGLGVALEMLSPEQVPTDVAEVIALLKEMGVTNAVFDPSIVRGFDYYTGIVFEIFDTHPENNRSVFGGGRYNGLTSLFDEENIPAVGCAAGDVTIKEFLAVRNLLPTYLPPTQLYIALTAPELASEAAKLATELREQKISVAVDFGDKKLGDQIKVANKHKIPYLVVVGEDEIKSDTFKLKNLESGDERSLDRQGLVSFFAEL
jgi:histidyl-tRNA synthetase